MTGEAHALKALFGENSSGSASYKLAVATICSRLSGVFASLKVCSLPEGACLFKTMPSLCRCSQSATAPRQATSRLSDQISYRLATAAISLSFHSEISAPAAAARSSRASCAMGVRHPRLLAQEFPSIRFRASKPVGDDPGSGLETQALVSQRVALELDERLRQFQQAGQLPATHTCELIIVDRSVLAHLSHSAACQMSVDMLMRVASVNTLRLGWQKVARNTLQPSPPQCSGSWHVQGL